MNETKILDDSNTPLIGGGEQHTAIKARVITFYNKDGEIDCVGTICSSEITWNIQDNQFKIKVESGDSLTWDNTKLIHKNSQGEIIKVRKVKLKE